MTVQGMTFKHDANTSRAAKLAVDVNAMPGLF